MDENQDLYEINAKIALLKQQIAEYNTDTSMSSNINELQDIKEENTEVINDNEIELFDETINLDEIIENEEILNNKFIKYITKESNLRKDPYISTTIIYFLKKAFNIIFKKQYKNRIFTILIRLFHLLEILFIGFGIFLPSKFLSFYIIICLKHLILWDIFDGKHYLSLIVEKISGFKYYDLFYENITLLKGILLLNIFISVIGIVLPKYGIFYQILSIFNFLKKYN